MRTLLAVLLSTLSLSASAGAQAPDLDVDRLKLGTDSLAIFMVRDGEARRIGTLWDEIRQSREGAVRRVYRTENAVFGANLDTIVTRAADFRPVYESSRGAQGSHRVEYRPDSIVGWRATSTGSRLPIARLANPALYNGASFDLMLRATPLGEGFSLEIPAYVPSQDSVLRLRARVTGAELLPTAGGETSVWVVEMDFGGLSSTLWVDQGSRALVQQVIRLNPQVAILMTRPELAGITANQAVQGRSR